MILRLFLTKLSLPTILKVPKKRSLLQKMHNLAEPIKVEDKLRISKCTICFSNLFFLFSKNKLIQDIHIERSLCVEQGLMIAN